ncbi:MAG: winged helix-turn-helix domain-containing protein [Acidobacteria bacterium]|nr:winged helix-turn-helix domain-containing protein [Acidobacteriota bacterium]
MTVQHFASFAFDPDQLHLQRAGNPVEIRPKSACLLAFFLANPGRIIPKSELIQVLWQDAFVTDDSLFQSIRELRQVLGEHKSQPFIKTIPKQGYMWICPVETSQPKPAEKPRQKSRILLVFLMVPVFLILLLLWPISDSKSLFAVPEEKPYYSLLILPTDCSADLSSWAPQGLTRYWVERIAASPQYEAQDLGLIDKTSLLPFLPLDHQEDRLIELAYRTGSDWILHNRLSREGTDWLLKCRATGQDRSTWEFSVKDNDFNHLIHAYEVQLSRQFQAKMGWSKIITEAESLPEKDLIGYLGSIQIQLQGNSQAALKQLELLAQDNPKDQRLPLRIAEIQMQLGNLHDPSCLNVERIPSSDIFRYWLLAAKFYELVGAAEKQKAAYYELFRSGAEHGSGRAQLRALSALARISLDESNLDLAQHHAFQALHFARALSSGPDELSIRVLLGQILFLQKQYEAAKSEWSAALSKAQQLQNPFVNADTLFQLGRLEMEQKQIERARTHFKQARQLFQWIGKTEALAGCDRLLLALDAQPANP